MKYTNKNTIKYKYIYDSNLLHEECKKLYLKPHKLLITHEVSYLMNYENTKLVMVVIIMIKIYTKRY